LSFHLKVAVNILTLVAYHNPKSNIAFDIIPCFRTFDSFNHSYLIALDSLIFDLKDLIDWFEYFLFGHKFIYIDTHFLIFLALFEFTQFVFSLVPQLLRVII
jgi:hypothetical protein